MNKKSGLIIIIFYLILGISVQTRAQSTDLDSLLDEIDSITKENIFASLKSISVAVSFKEAPLLDGFADKQIKADIETKLSQSGFIIGGDSFLLINVKSISSGGSITSFLIKVSLSEKFILARDKTITRNETVWAREKEIRPDNAGKNTIRDAILSLVDRLIEICAKSKKNSSKTVLPKTKESQTTKKSTQKINQDSTIFTATYIGGNRPPEVEIFNDSDRTLYLDLGQDKLIAYTIKSGESKIIQLTDGNYNFKANAPRVIPLEGNHNFQKGYRYTWRFTIVKQ